MQAEYFDRLSEPLREFVLEVENGAGLPIRVESDPDLNTGGPFGQGNLAVIIEAKSITLFAPTNGYFPDGAVRHEVLHAERFHIDRAPKLTLADAAPWDKGFSDALGRLDNAIEHLFIVPEELQLHPERRAHWEGVMHEVCAELDAIPEGERDLAISMHWAFVRDVIPQSPSMDILRRYAIAHGLLETANRFADKVQSAMPSKEEVVRQLFLEFPFIPRARSALEYINSVTGTRQEPIP